MRFTPGSGLRPYLRKVKRRGLTRCFVTCGVRFPPQTEGDGVGWPPDAGALWFHRRPRRRQQWFRERRGAGPRQGLRVASPRAGSRPSWSHSTGLSWHRPWCSWVGGLGRRLRCGPRSRLPRPFGGSFLVRKGRPVLFSMLCYPLLSALSRDSSKCLSEWLEVSRGPQIASPENQCKEITF